MIGKTRKMKTGNNSNEIDMKKNSLSQVFIKLTPIVINLLI